MGYSCTAAAYETLQKIKEACLKESGSLNQFKNSRGNTYFWEIGKEQDDGAITGSIMRVIKKDGKEQAYQSTTFRINPDGTIERFMKFKDMFEKRLRA